MSDRIQFIPNDEKFYDIQDFLSLSQTKNWGIDACLIEEAWKITKGKDVVVAILDTGISDHVDLQGQWYDPKNFSKCDSHEDKKSGHGTHVAGIIAARDNSDGCVGIAPECKIIPMKVLDDDGGGSYLAVEKAIRECIRLGNVDIINMSLGAPGAPPQSLHDVIIEATNKGIIIIAAAGNDGKIVNYPARYDEVIAVAALDANGNMAGFSSRDNTVDSVAPGVDIFSTFTNNQYAKMSGTSQAAPFMAGICALLKSFAKSDPSAPKINNYVDMLKAIDIVCDHAEYVNTGRIVNGDVVNWGYGVPKFCNIDWRTV